MTRLTTALALACWLGASTTARAQPAPNAEPPRMTVIVPRTAGAQTPQLRERLESALRENGATLVPNTELRSAGKRLNIPVDRSPSAPAAKQLSSDLNLDGIVELRVRHEAPRTRSQRATYQAELRVIGPDGVERLDTEVPLAGRTPTAKEAETLANIAVGAVQPPAQPPTPPTPPAAPTPAPEAGAETGTTPRIPPPVVTPPASSTLPPPRTLIFGAAPNLTWREGGVNGAPGINSLDFSTGAPYAGFTLAVETFPFLGGWAQYLGFDALYSFSMLGLDTVNPTTNTTVRQSATENRLLLDVIGRYPGSVFGGDLTLRLGVAYEGFVVEPVGSLVTSQHVGPRIFGAYQRPLFSGIAVNVGLGYRPFAHPGGGLTIAFGERQQSYGVEARAGFTGPLDFLVKNLRWAAGYDFLRYSDRFQSAAGETTSIENYHRILLGLTYQPTIRF